MAKKVRFEFDPFEIAGVPKSELTASEKKSALEDVADFVLTSVLDSVGGRRSPVKGQGAFPALSPGYKKRKKDEAAPIPNLELSGDMLDSMTVDRKRDKLVLTVSTSEEAKAAAHNWTKAFPGADTNKNPMKKAGKRRAFIPDKGRKETFKRDILKGISGIVREAEEESE